MARKTASGEEAAAVAAAIVRFEEFLAVSAEGPSQVSAWQQAALIEGVGAKENVLEAEGGSRWLS